MTAPLTDWYLGETKKFSGTVTLAGVALDISDDTVRLMVKEAITDADEAAKLSVDADAATSGASGIYLMTIDPADTAALTAREYHYDLWLIRDNGDKYLLEKGRVNLLAAVSDPAE